MHVNISKYITILAVTVLLISINMVAHKKMLCMMPLPIILCIYFPNLTFLCCESNIYTCPSKLLYFVDLQIMFRNFQVH